MTNTHKYFCSYCGKNNLVELESVEPYNGVLCETELASKPETFIDACSSQFVDTRDGQVYKTVKIGKQTWMAENLNFGDYPSVDKKYGKLYTWEEAMKVAPKGWHLPTDDEWTELENFLGGREVAGGKMKSVEGWNKPNEGATNESGFTALPGGNRSSAGSFSSQGSYAYLWSATESPTGGVAYAWSLYLNYYSAQSYRYAYYEALGGFSVRCVKDR